jgi:hypothetical protein
MLPDLFKEGKGVVAQGKLGADGVFVADQVLAKHDENYMPPEAADERWPSCRPKQGQMPRWQMHPYGGRTMIPEVGHFALILALAVALAQSVLPLIGSFNAAAGWMALARPASPGLLVPLFSWLPSAA